MHRNQSTTVVLLSTLLSIQTSIVAAADWPQFRGPDGLGTSADRELPTAWSATENIAWKTDLPGHGASSPIVVGDRIYVTCYSGYGQNEESPGDIAELTRQLVCLARDDGRILWRQAVAASQPEQEFEGFLALHGYASSTPACDGERIYVFFGRTGVLAFDLEGRELWRTSVGTGTHGWGSAASPIVVGDLVIVNASVESGSLAALDRRTGQMVWRREGVRRSWGTPAVARLSGNKLEIVLSMQGNLVAYDPATGDELWRVDGIDDYICPSVISHAGVIYAIGGRSNRAMAVRAGGRGDVGKTHVLWTTPKGSNVSSPVYHAGHLYFVNDVRGVAYCLDASNGEVKYEERMEPRPDRFYASPVAADGKLYYVSRYAGAFVLAAEPSYRLVSHSAIADDESVFNASTVIHDSQLLLRSDKALYCIGPRASR